MFKTSGVVEPTESGCRDEDSIFRTRKRFSPEQQLLFALLLRNFRDVKEETGIRQKNAIAWFESRNNDWFTWLWTADHLNFCSRTTGRIEALIIFR